VPFETDHNPSGMRSFWRKVAGLALISWLAVSGLVPPEHVHEADADHPSAITHRHFEAHDHEGTEISHGEGRVVWLDDVAVEHARIQASVALAVLTVTFDAVPPVRPSMAVLTLDAAPPHGPPRSTASLRAPPASHLA
jgi:hypothetical protein